LSKNFEYFDLLHSYRIGSKVVGARAKMVAERGEEDQGLDARAEREDARELQAMVDHWIAAIDRWVKQFDRDMGAGGVVTEGDGEPDPSPAP